MSSSGKRPQKQRIQGGRTTPKGGGASKRRIDSSLPDESTRYTPPVPNYRKESPRWVPILMFTFFAVGMLVIFLHYVDLLLPGAPSNWWLMIGLMSILGGIITATQYR